MSDGYMVFYGALARSVALLPQPIGPGQSVEEADRIESLEERLEGAEVYFVGITSTGAVVWTQRCPALVGRKGEME